MSILDISISILLIILGANLKKGFSSFDFKDRSFLTKLYWYHVFIALLFAVLVKHNGGDAILYWDFPKTYSLQDVWSVIERGSASGIIYLINYFPSKILNLSFYTGTIFYANLGFLGFIYFYSILKSVLKEDFELITTIQWRGIAIHPLIWFLPNLHYWSVGIGKDTILFFCIAAFIYSLINIKRRLILLGFSVILALLIRPHMILFLITSFGVVSIFNSKLAVYKRVFLASVFAVAFIALFGYVTQFIQLESLETQTIEEYTDRKAANLNQSDSGSGIDISGYPYPLKVFTFLYRPLFFDINGVLAIIASFENLILLLLTIKCLRSKPLRALKAAPSSVKVLLIFFLIGAASFSLILGNLGIMLRQKNAFIPGFIIVVLYVLYDYHIKKNSLKVNSSA